MFIIEVHVIENYIIISCITGAQKPGARALSC